MARFQKSLAPPRRATSRTVSAQLGHDIFQFLIEGKRHVISKAQGEILLYYYTDISTKLSMADDIS
jgi:hypothetical protein